MRKSQFNSRCDSGCFPLLVSETLKTTKIIALVFVFAATLASAQSTKIIQTPTDVAAAPPDAEKTASGLASKVIEAGTGKTHPARTDRVTVDYTGWTTDGKMFDSSLPTGKTVTFSLDKVIAGWTEGVQLMVAGEKRRFWIPESLAYKGQQGRPQGTLVFDVKLISFTKPPTQTPTDFRAPPSAARRTRAPGPRCPARCMRLMAICKTTFAPAACCMNWRLPTLSVLFSHSLALKRGVR